MTFATIKGHSGLYIVSLKCFTYLPDVHVRRLRAVEKSFGLRNRTRGKSLIRRKALMS
jgi:hypothetical protein